MKSASVKSSDLTGLRSTEDYSAYNIVEMPVVTYGDLGHAEIRCEIIIGGVTFVDGTVTKTLTSQNFNLSHTCNLYFKKPITAHSNCHRFKINDGNVTLASFN